MNRCVELLALYSLICSGYAQDFGYDGNEGPSNWGKTFQRCIGKHQSPIDIEEQNVTIVRLQNINFQNFDIAPDFLGVENNGHTVKVTVNSTLMPTISGGPLVGDYILAQFHWHWGTNDEEGSETRINNSSYPMELHMVFYYAPYGSMAEASDHPDGLVVLAFMYSTSQKENANYQSLIAALPLIEKPKSFAIINNAPPIDAYLVRNRSVYFTYSGSLTTPPCSEVVTWIEFKNTIPLAHEQIDFFRQLSGEKGKLLHNFRPPQPLHGRVIRMNLPDEREVRRSFEPIYRRRNSSSTKHATVYIVFALLLANSILVF